MHAVRSRLSLTLGVGAVLHPTAQYDEIIGRGGVSAMKTAFRCGGGVRQWFAVPRECGRCRIAALCGDAARLERRVREFVLLSATIRSEHCTVCNDHVRREYCMPPPSITPPPSKKNAAAQNQIYHHIFIFTFLELCLAGCLDLLKTGIL